MNSNANILLMGGPATGKSNYIFRLWLAMDDGRGRLKKDSLPDQLDYLNGGAQMLLGGQFAPRTPRDTFNRVEIPFQLAEIGRKGKLIVPDISGEDCDRHYTERQWSSEWEDRIPRCEGCLVFLRESVLHTPLSWIDVSQLLGVVDEQKAEPDKLAPTQVLLVEWLQFIRQALDDTRGYSFIPRIAIIVAAWDELGEEIAEEGPDVFLEQFTPLLHHFIEMNRGRFEVMVFGTSVVGGDLAEDSEFRERYLKSNPHESGYVVYTSEGALKQSDDITIPVAWILGSAID